MSGKERRAKKLIRINYLYEKFSTNKQIILVSLDNVSSRQIQSIRALLRKTGGELIVGKNVNKDICGL